MSRPWFVVPRVTFFTCRSVLEGFFSRLLLCCCVFHPVFIIWRVVCITSVISSRQRCTTMYAIADFRFGSGLLFLSSAKDR